MKTMTSKVALVAAVLMAVILQTSEVKAAPSEYGFKVAEACTKFNSLLSKRFGYKGPCKKVTFTCQEKLWHVPEIWRVVVDPSAGSHDLASGTVKGQAFSLITGLGVTTEYHRLDRMDPWVIIPVEKTEKIDRKLIIHQDKLSGAMVIKKRVFDKQSGYQDAEYKYYCRSSISEFKR